MITDPNYVCPAHLTNDYFLNILSADSARILMREMSGNNGEEPMTVVEQVTSNIEFALNYGPDETRCIY